MYREDLTIQRYRGEDWPEWSALKVVPDPIPEAEVSTVSASPLASAEATPPASPGGFRDFSLAFTDDEPTPAAVAATQVSAQDDAKEEIDFNQVQDCQKYELNQATKRLRGSFEQLKEQITLAREKMEGNPLYKSSSNKLKAVKLLQATLDTYMVLPEDDAALINNLPRYQHMLMQSIALASIIVGYNTKGSRKAQVVQFFKASTATEIEPFLTWVKKLPLASSVHATTQDLKTELAASIKEVGVLDAQKPFKSLLERIEERTAQGKEGEFILFELIRFGSSSVEQHLSAQGLS